MKGILFLSSIVVLATAKPGGYYHQEYNYKSSSASYKNNELQQKNENQGFYSKDGDLEGRMKPKVNSHSQHSEYTNPKLLQGESVDLGTGYTGGNMNQANFGRLFGSNMNGYHSGGAADTFASTDRIMDLSNVYTSGGHGSSHRNFGTSMGYGNHAGGYGTNSLGYGTSSGGYGSSSSGYTSTSNGYGSNLGDYGRTHESMGTSNGGNYANSMGSSSNYGYTQGGRSYGYVQHGSSSSGYRSTNANLNSMVQRLQDEMTRQLQNAVNNQYRTSGYTTSVSTSQMTADIRALEDELKRNLTRQMEESLRSQYGQQELRGTDYYTVVPGRQSTVANYRNQELADLTGQLEDNLLKQLHQSIRTTYNRESGSTYTSSNNLYRPTYVSSTYRPSHYERIAVVIPSNIRYTPIPNPDSITQIASRIQSEINLYLDNALQNIYSTYIQNGRNSYTLTDFDNEVNRIRDQIIRNLTWNLDDQIRRNYGQQILKDDHYYSISSTGQTSTLHNYNVKDYENLKKQVEENLMKKLNQTVNTYRDQYQKQQSYSTSTNYYTATFRPVYYTSGNQVYDYSDLQRQLSEQLQNALNKHRYSQSASYSVSTSSNPRAYQISLDELSRELQRNLTEQLNNYRAHSSSSSYGYTSGSSIGGRSADFESMKKQLQNQLMQQLQQGLQKQYRYSASASYSASSSSSSNANYGSHQSYGNYGNMYPSHRYKRDAALYIPAGHYFSYKSAKSSRTYSSSSQFSSQEENGGMNFLHHTHDLKPHEFDDSMNFHRTSGSHFGTSFAGSDESSPEVVEDVINHHQVERPQKLYMAGHHQGAFGNPQNYLPNYHHFPESHHKSVDEELRPHHPQFPEQDMQEQLMNKNSGHYSTQQFQQTADSHFRFAQHHQLPEQQSQVDLDQKLEFNHPQQQQTDDYQKQVAFTPAIQVPEQQSQEDLEQKLEFKHPQLPEQQSQEDLHQKLEFQHPHQIQTHNSRKHFELTSDQHEQQPQEDLDQQLELNHPRIPKPIISYHQQPDQNLEDQNELTQQLEQEPQLEQKIQKPDFSSVHHQQTEDLDSQKLEPLEQQVDNQNELPKDLEQQQLEQDHIPEPKRAQHSGKSKDELTGNFDQNQDDLTQQLEEEPKYHPQIDNQPIEDLNYQQVQTSNDQKQTELHHMPSNKQSPEQDDLTQQQIQDDLTQQQIQDDLTQPQLKDDLSQQQIQDDLTQPQLKDDMSQQQIQDGLTQQQIQDDLSQQLTADHIPVNEPGYPPEQELEQQSETDAKNVIVAEKINQQTEKPKFENQNDLTQEQELEQQLETESKNLFVPEKLNHRPDQQELEDQNDLTQQYEVEGKQEKTHSQEGDLTQQLELARKPEQNLIPEHHLEVEPKSSTKPKQGAYDQSQVEQSEEDMTQQLLLDNKLKPKNIPEQELTGQVEDDLNQKLEQQQTTNQEIPEQENTQQQETEQSLEPVDQKLEQKHQDQTENNVSQELELMSSNELEKHPNVEQPKHNVDQKLELFHPQKHDQLDQQVQKQTDLDSIPKRATHIENEQTLEQSSENHLTQQLESDNIATHRKPNYSPNFNQELENNNDQQLELTDIHKPQESVTNNDQQTQLKLTDVKTDNDQKQQTDQSIDEFPGHSLNHLDNPITVSHQRPQSVFNNYQHSSSSERSFTNGHSNYPTGNYEEALRQQDALLDLLNQKIHQQSENPSPYGQRIIKKTTYINVSPVSTFGTGHFTESNGEIKNSETTSLNENTFPGSQLTELHGIYRHGYTGTTSSKSTRTVVHFVNGKPVSAMEYIRIVKPNGQIVDSKHEIPLTPDLIKRFSKGSSPNHVADTMRTTNHFVGSTEDIPSSENFIRQHPYSHRTSGHHTINMADNTERTGHYGVHPTENFFQNKQFSHHLHQGQLTKNMGNHFKVDGLRAVNRFDHVVGDDHDITSMGDLLRQNEFSQGVNQFSQHINDRLDGLGVSSHSFPQDINAFDNSFKTSGFSGQASKKTSHYVNGKLVSSSESHQRIGPDGRITEVERGSNPSLIGNLEQQLADLQDSYSGHKGSVEQQISGLHNIYSGHKSKDTSRCRVKTSRHIRRIDC